MALKIKVGDLIVYPAKGVGRIMGVEKMGSEEFYIIELLEKGIQIKVPVKRAERMGIRSPIPSSRAKKILSMIKNYKTAGLKVNWNKRQKFFREKLLTGKIEDTVEVFAELLYSSRKKPLSFGEKKLMDQVKNMLLQELSLSVGTDTETIKKEFESLLT